MTISAQALHAQIDHLAEYARKYIAGCRAAATDGTFIYMPDGEGCYQALWTRDFTYMVEYAGEMIPMDETKACIEMLIAGQSPEGVVPDRVSVDCRPIYIAGPESSPIGRYNLDNGAFLAIVANEYLKRLAPDDARAQFAAWAPSFELGLACIPRDDNGLVWNDPAFPHSPYGFTDCIGKTGGLFMESLLTWRAYRCMSHWSAECGDAGLAASYATAAAAIESAIGTLWDDTEQLFVAATVDCRQVDVWANAYAVVIGFPLSADQRDSIVRFFAEQYDTYAYAGQVRHLRKGEYWSRTLNPPRENLSTTRSPDSPSPDLDRYQNGAYWATPTGWVMETIALRDPDLAARMFMEMMADFNQNGVCECINKGYRQLETYVVSATNPLYSARKLFGGG
ncbi:MAG TPA: hypothetical protein VGK19_21440 [Capsulimonadaceae bacterium]|jgi:hypothetical protein